MAHMRVLQLVPALRCGGVERGTVEIDAALGPSRSLVASSGGPLTNLLCGLHMRWPSLRWRDPLSVLFINPLLLIYAVNRHGISIVPSAARSRCRRARCYSRPACARRDVARFHTATSWWRRAFNGLLLGADRLILRASACAATWRASACARRPTAGPSPRGAAPEHFAPPPPPSSSPTPSSPPPVALLLGRVSRSRARTSWRRSRGCAPAAMRSTAGSSASTRAKAGPSPRARRVGRRRRQRPATAARRRRRRRRRLRRCRRRGDAVAPPRGVRPRPPRGGGARLVVAFHHGAAGEVAAALWRHAGGGPMRRVRPGVALVGSAYLVVPLDAGALAAAIGDALRWRTTRGRRERGGAGGGEGVLPGRSLRRGRARDVSGGAGG